jgi:hypothetical protein
MAEHLVFHTFRFRQSDVKSPIFEKIMQDFLKVPKNGLQLQYLHAHWINSLEKVPFFIVASSWESLVTKLSRGFVIFFVIVKTFTFKFGYFFLCTHSWSWQESIWNVGTHPMRAKQDLEQRLILEDKKRKKFSTKNSSWQMNQDDDEMSITQMHWQDKL